MILRVTLRNQVPIRNRIVFHKLDLCTANFLARRVSCPVHPSMSASEFLSFPIHSACSDSRGTGVGSFALTGVSGSDLTDAQLYVGMFAPALFPLSQPQPQPQQVDEGPRLPSASTSRSMSSAPRTRSLAGSIDFSSASPGLWRTFESYHSGWWKPRYRVVSYDGRVLAEGHTRRMKGGDCRLAVI